MPNPLGRFLQTTATTVAIGVSMTPYRCRRGSWRAKRLASRFVNRRNASPVTEYVIRAGAITPI
jgi:hypothetical protein